MTVIRKIFIIESTDQSDRVSCSSHSVLLVYFKLLVLNISYLLFLFFYVIVQWALNILESLNIYLVIHYEAYNILLPIA